MKAKFDAIVFGNGATINLLNQLKPYVENKKLYLFDINQFLKKFISNGLNPREEEKIFSTFYMKKSIENIKYFKQIKYELNRFYLKNNGNIESILGKDILCGKSEDIGYDIGKIKSLFPILYNIWFDMLYNYIIHAGLETYVDSFYESIKERLINCQNTYTTNFDWLADKRLNPKHLHGKFVENISKCQDICLYKNDKEFYFKHIWGWNGIGKEHLMEELCKVENSDKYFNFDFFYSKDIKIDNLLLYGLSFQRSGYITEEFLQLYPKYKSDNLVGSVIDEHILWRLRGMQNLKQLNNVFATYYSEDERNYFKLLFQYYKINNFQIIHASEFDFKIK